MIKFTNLLKKDGMALMTVLMLTVLLTLMTVSMVYISTNYLSTTGNIEEKSKALRAAEAGVEYAIYMFDENPSWGLASEPNFPNDPNQLPTFLHDNSAGAEVSLSSNSKFTITFSDANPRYRSVNNLFESDSSNALSTGCPCYTAKIVSTGIAGKYKKVIRAYLVRSDYYPYTINSEGSVILKSGQFYITGDGPLDTEPPGYVYSGWQSTPMPDNYSVSCNDVSFLSCNGGMLSGNGPIKGPQDLATPFDGGIKENYPQNMLDNGEINVKDILVRAEDDKYGSLTHIKPGMVVVSDSPPDTPDTPGTFPSTITANSMIELEDVGGTGFTGAVTIISSGQLKIIRLNRDLYISSTSDQATQMGEIDSSDRFKDLPGLVDDISAGGVKSNVFRIYRDAECVYEESYNYNFTQSMPEEPGGEPEINMTVDEGEADPRLIRLDLNGHNIFSNSHLVLGVEVIGKGKIVSYGKIACLQGINSDEIVLISNDDIIVEMAENTSTSKVKGFYCANDDITVHPIPSDSVLLPGSAGGTRSAVTYPPGTKFYTNTDPPGNCTGIGDYNPPPTPNGGGGGHHGHGGDSGGGGGGSLWTQDYTGNGIIVSKVEEPSGDYKIVVTPDSSGGGGLFQFCLEYDGKQKINLGDNILEITTSGEGPVTKIMSKDGKTEKTPTSFSLDADKLNIFGAQIQQAFDGLNLNNITMVATIASFNKYKNVYSTHAENRSNFDTGSRDGTMVLSQDMAYIKSILNLERTSFKIRKVSSYEIE